ncbi:DNA recombination protein RmuC [Dermabacter hominis]|uniref:DNA recombination protein RmuC n=1 Tax=Dermabacter hominis TaxID=36740 RepID=UPI00223AE902|nr:DNA recombination protein RmuC [Dermabacter hominis]MCT2025295.1 DNA recombination protein RmuC [Dermabacter hominis]
MNLSTLVTVLVPLLIGGAIGALLAWALMRERVRSAEARAEANGADVEALAARAVNASSTQLLQLASERFERDSARREAVDAARSEQLARTLSPISETLTSLERSVARTEAARQKADGDLASQLKSLSERTRDLGTGTNALVAALKAPTSRGQWGEVQLRRIVEAAGMLEHTDFTEQQSGRNAGGEKGQRPDLVVHLSHGRTIVVDAKAPMDAYLRAAHATDRAERAKHLAEHARALRSHVTHLSSKSYWASLGDSPEFVVMFVPSDGLLAGALESDPGLLDGAFMLDVVIASPATLMALLRTVAHTWRTDALNHDALRVLEAGREVHKRLGTLSGHLSKLGRSLESSVRAFNGAVGSYETRVLPAARTMEELQVVGSALENVEPVTQLARDIDPSNLNA